MDRSLASLDSRFQPKVYELLAKYTEAQIPVMIINTRRTAEEQAEAVKTNHSQVTHSLHQDGLAIDICPFDTYQLHGEDKLKWDMNDPIWWKIGFIGESLGLRWGGRFGNNGDLTKLGWDPGHFELVLHADTSIKA